MNTIPMSQLKRIRWAVRAALVLGVAASVAANILHARPNPISQVIAAWPPLALLLTVELISRVPVHRRSLGVVRVAATATIAGIAAWVSYWHTVGVASRYGETGASPYLLPLSVDGVVIVASISLVELAGRIRAVETAANPTASEPATGTANPTATDTASAPPETPPTDTANEPPPDRQRQRRYVRHGSRQRTAKRAARRTATKAADGAAKVHQAHTANPTATNKELAEAAGVSLRTVERHRPKPAGTAPANLVPATTG